MPVDWSLVACAICDRADEIAYTSADLEDGLVSTWISENQLQYLDLWRMALARADQDFPGARDIHRRIAATRNVLHILVEDLASKTMENIAAMKIASLDDARNAERKCADFSDEISRMLEQMQQFLTERLYLRKDSTEEQDRSRVILTTLFEKYVSDPGLLPERYSSRAGKAGMDGRTEDIHRIVCDYIAGMTDRFCREEFARLT